jgi:hypothetical protein
VSKTGIDETEVYMRSGGVFSAARGFAHLADVRVVEAERSVDASARVAVCVARGPYDFVDLELSPEAAARLVHRLSVLLEEGGYNWFGTRLPHHAARAEYDAAVAAHADKWVPANRGSETPITTRTGRRLQYCYNPGRHQHAYLDVATDLVLTDEEAQAALDKG